MAAGVSSGPVYSGGAGGTPIYDPFNRVWILNGKAYGSQAEAFAASQGTIGSLESLKAAGTSASDVYAASTAEKTAAQTQANLEAAQKAQLAKDAADRAFAIQQDATKTQADREAAAAEAQRARDAAAAAAQNAAAAQQAAAGYASASQLQDEKFQTSTAATQNATAQAAQDRMIALLQPFLTSMGGGGGGGGGGSTSTATADTAQAAQSAAFGRAKDQTADLARSSLMSLRAAAAERGVNVAGGTNPALLASEGKVISNANQPLADLTRQQAIDTSGRAAAVDDRNYAGNIALQGQKAQLAPSLLSLMKVSGIY